MIHDVSKSAIARTVMAVKKYLARTVAAIPFLVVAAHVGAAPPLSDESSNCQALATRMRQLETQIHALEAKVTGLEQAQKIPASAATQGVSTSPATTSEVAAEAAAQLRREDAAVDSGWKQIAKGINQGDVKRLLGTPQQVFDLSGKRVWYYYYPANGSGSVMFDAGGRVVGYQSPPSSGFHLY